jgi:flagellar hook-length control protein FliK
MNHMKGDVDKTTSKASETIEHEAAASVPQPPVETKPSKLAESISPEVVRMPSEPTKEPEAQVSATDKVSEAVQSSKPADTSRKEAPVDSAAVSANHSRGVEAKQDPQTAVNIIAEPEVENQNQTKSDSTAGGETNRQNNQKEYTQTIPTVVQKAEVKPANPRNAFVANETDLAIEVEPDEVVVKPTSVETKTIDPEQIMTASVETNLPIKPDPVQARQFVSQVNTAVLKMVEDGESSLNLQLHPEDLGAIDLNLKSGKDGLQISFRVDNPQTQMLLERHLGELREVLQRAGISLNQLSVGSQGQQNQAHNSPFQEYKNRSGLKFSGPVVEETILQEDRQASTSNYGIDYRI